MKNIETRLPAQGKQNVLKRFIKTLKGRISDVFKPQEVEVTFKKEGKKVRYTYTKVSEKRVA